MEEKELIKLSEIDRKIITWMIDNAPDNLRYWVDHITPIYNQNGVIIDADRLFAEVTVK